MNYSSFYDKIKKEYFKRGKYNEIFEGCKELYLLRLGIFHRHHVVYAHTRVRQDRQSARHGKILTVSDALRFVTMFRTDGRIEDASNKEEAEERCPDRV